MTEITVQADTLANICKQHVPEGAVIDFLKIDTEGYEEIVLKSADFERFRPVVLVVEATIPGVDPLSVESPEERAVWHGFEGHLDSVGYDFVYFDGLNRFYLAREHAGKKGLFSMPVGIFDGVDYRRLEKISREQVATIETLEQLGRGQTATIETLEGRLESAESRNRDLGTEADSLRRQLEAERQKSRELEADLEGLRQHDQSLSGQIGNLSAALQAESKRSRNLAVAMHAWDAQFRCGLIRRCFAPCLTLPEIPDPWEPSRAVVENGTSLNLRISVITPSFNSGNTIERAIQSVLDQGYPDIEHIVVDGGSTDGTLDVLKKYDHLRWVSEPDRGQVHAMNKGFEMATGDVIAYLNADDYYAPGAFSAVMAGFSGDAVMVYGNVEVYDEAQDRWWTNEPRTDFRSILHHWEMNAFCVNPVGYFYRREVQENVPYREENGAKMDLAFLMEAARLYEGRTRKIGRTLGVFMNTRDTRTVKEQSQSGYWTPENFSFIDRLLQDESEAFRERFRLRQQEGYAKRERETAAGAEAIYLPSTEYDLIAEQATVVDRKKYRLAAGDPVVVFLSYGKVGSSAVCRTLEEEVKRQGGNMPVYHLHNFPRTLKAPPEQCMPHTLSGHALRQVFEAHRGDLNWKFISGVREPISFLLSGYYEMYFMDKGEPSIEDVREALPRLLPWHSGYMDRELCANVGLDPYAVPFDRDKGYTILREGAVSLLVFRQDRLSAVFPDAVHDFLGFRDVGLVDANIGTQKDLVANGVPYAESYRRTRETFVLPVEQLEEIYSHPGVTHFYSPEEIRRFIEYWSSPGEHRNSPAVESGERAGIVYDVGLHDGQDTDFYLKKGFKVVAIDANPAVVGAAEKRFGRAVASGRLTLLNLGITQEDRAEPLEFYVNEKITEWSSFVKDIALRDGHPYHVEKVACRTLASVVREHGAPYYVKIDIEGHDKVALQSMLEAGLRPQYVSVENGNDGMLKLFKDAGYTDFKYVQQRDIPGTRAAATPLEGRGADHLFPPGASGPFGEETPGPWMDHDAAREAVSRVWDPDGNAKNPGHDDARDGWFDLHARLGTDSGKGGAR